MPDHDLVLLRTLVSAHGLAEVLLGLSAICSTKSLEVASYDAHTANEWMHRSVELDGLAAEYELEPT